MKTDKWLSLACIVTVLCVLAGSSSLAWGIAFTSRASGDWDNDTGPLGTWDPDGAHDFPISGDTAAIGHTINVTSPEEFGVAAGNSTWSAGNLELTDTLTLLDGTLEYTGGSLQMNGVGGEFINQGTFEQNSTSTMFLGVVDDTIFRNQGTFDFVNAASTSHVTLHGKNSDPSVASRFINESGAIVRRTASGKSEFNVHNANLNRGTFEGQSGSIFDAVDAAAVINLEGGNTTVLGKVEGATFQGDGQIQFQGYWSEISGSISGDATVHLTADGAGAHTIPTGGTVYSLAGNSTGLEWSGNHIITASGQNATNQGLFTYNSGSALQINGDGEFINAAGATLRYDTTSILNIAVGVGDTTLRNAGTIDFVNSGTTTITAHGGGGTIINESTGVIRRDATGLAILNDSGANGDFSNLGKVEVTAGTIQVASSLSTTSVSGGNELTEGTWNVLSGTGTATLDLDAGGTSAGSIVTIGSTASVLMGGNNPVFSQLSVGSLTVNGSFGVQNQNIHTLSGSLTAPGTLLFGLEAADVGGTLLTGLDIAGNVDFTGGMVDINDLGDMVEGTYRLIEWDGTRTDFLTLGSVPDNGFAYELITMDTGSGFVNLEVSAPVVPEPSTAMLLILGMIGMSQVSRRRRNTA